MFHEAARRTRGRPVAAHCEPRRRAGTRRVAAALRTARRGDLRPRQLRSCCDLRPLPDRDAHGPARFIRRALGQLGLRRRERTSNRSCSSRSPSPARARTCSPPRRRRGPRARSSSRSSTSTDSPLASAASCTIPLRAGPETSVAATKSYIATLAALAQLVAKLDAGRGAPRRPGCRTGCARARLGARLERGDRAASTGHQPVRRCARARPRHCPGGGAQVQGNLRPARRGLQLRRAAPRPGGDGRPRIPGARVRAAR